MGKQFVITGIGTDIGKTVVSAILSEHLNATYWKPIQAGDLENSDTIKVRSWCSDKVSVFPELFRLNSAMSPHAAAKIDGIDIQLNLFQLPDISGNLIIEGAGGIMVPLNQKGDLFIDLIEQWKLPVILVSRHYLGSINHTLLSVETLKNRKIEIEGIIFVGDEHTATEQILLQKTGLTMLARIPIVNAVDRNFIKEQAQQINLPTTKKEQLL